jgi:hypothetical protein
MDIPKFYLWKIDQFTLVNGYPDGEMKQYYKGILEHKRSENDEIDPHVFEVVDGQQRIRTILEYMGTKPKNNFCYRGPWHETFPALADTPMAKAASVIGRGIFRRLWFCDRIRCGCRPACDGGEIRLPP